METLTRLVSESLARHGFDRPLDYRRLQWSRWFRCESHHSLLSVPSKPGVFALAEEIVDFGTDHVETAALGRPAGQSPAVPAGVPVPEAASRRMLAVTKFFDDDDMAFVLDRMLSCENPLRSRLNSGRYFVRYVVIEDPSQRRSISAALNQWIVSSADKATGIGAHFASSLELSPATEFVPQAHESQGRLFAALTTNGTAHANRESHDFSRTEKIGLGVQASAPEGIAETTTLPRNAEKSSAKLSIAAPQLDSGAASNIHCPSPFPSGF